MEPDKVRENRLRNAAKRQGFRLCKSRRRDPYAFDFGGYMIVDIRGNFAVAGSDPFDFSLSLDEVEKWLFREDV